MMNKEEITISFKDQTGFRVTDGDLTTGKVVVNGTEITSVEDWEKVTKSLVDLQQRINDAMDYINFLVIFNENINGKFNETIWGEELLEILGGKE